MATKESVALSRRVAQLMTTKVILDLSADEHIAFVDAVSNADSFDKLAAKYKALITKAESERDQKLAGLRRS